MLKTRAPEWVFIVVVVFLGILLIVHLSSLWIAVNECGEYAKIVMEQARLSLSERNALALIQAKYGRCEELSETFRAAVSQWAAILFALLGGGATANMLRKRFLGDGKNGG